MTVVLFCSLRRLNWAMLTTAVLRFGCMYRCGKRKRFDWLDSIDGANSRSEALLPSQNGSTMADLSSHNIGMGTKREQRSSYTAAEVLQEIMASLDSPNSDGDIDSVTASCGEPSSCLSAVTDNNNIRLSNSVCQPAAKSSLAPHWTPRHSRIVSHRCVRKPSDTLRSTSDLCSLSPTDSNMAIAGASSKSFYGSAKATPRRKVIIPRLANSTPRCQSRTVRQRRLLHKEELHCTLSANASWQEQKVRTKLPEEGLCQPPENPDISITTLDQTECFLGNHREDNSDDDQRKTLSQPPVNESGISTPPPSDVSSSSSASGDESAKKTQRLFPIFYTGSAQQKTPKRSTFLKYVSTLAAEEISLHNKLLVKAASCILITKLVFM